MGTRIALPIHDCLRSRATGTRPGVRIGRTCLLALLGFLVACASVPPDLGRSEVEDLVTARGLPHVANEDVDTMVEGLSGEALTVEAAIRIALINNPQLKAEFARLGFAAAEIYAAGRISNPRFSGAFLEPSVAGEVMQIGLGLAISFTDLLTLPARQRLAAAEFERAKQSIGAAVLDVAARTQADYYRLVTAEQVAALRSQTARAAALSAELAGRFHAAGNLSPRDLALERAAASEARLIALNAEVAVYRVRADFGATLGISTGLGWDVPDALPLPVDAEDAITDVLTLAETYRLDLAAARTGVDLLADRLGVTNWTRWLGDIGIGVETERETDGSRITGPTIGIEIPVFTQNRDAVLRAQADLSAAIAEFERVSIDVGNSVRRAHAEVLNARARIEEYRDTLVPQRAAAVARAQEEVNFMLIGVFELIASKQAEYDAYQGYIEAVGDYWLARTELSRTVNNALPSSLAASSDPLDLESVLQPEKGGMRHDEMTKGDMRMGGQDSMPGMDHGAHGADHARPPGPGPNSANEPGADSPPTAPTPRHDQRKPSGDER